MERRSFNRIAKFHLIKLVSIPFKRESTWKASVKTKNKAADNTSFNSLQTGKHMESVICLSVATTVGVFQFPSNGKAHGKPPEDDESQEVVEKFQFPSNGKAHGKYYRQCGKGPR